MPTFDDFFDGFEEADEQYWDGRYGKGCKSYNVSEKIAEIAFGTN